MRRALVRRECRGLRDVEKWRIVVRRRQTRVRRETVRSCILMLIGVT